MLRGTGLGKIKALRDLRDWIYFRVRPSEPVIVETKGIKLMIDANSSNIIPGFMWILFGREYEQYESDILRQQLREGFGVIDMGANIGYFALIAAKTVGNKGKVVAFEPEPWNFQLLKKNVELNNMTNITPVGKAVSDKAGTLTLYVDPSNTLCHHMYDKSDGATPVPVEVISIDEYIRANPMKVDVIKMDIEGFEPHALKGMKETLAKNPGLKILSEFYPEMIRQGGESAEKYLKDLRAYGFAISGIDEEAKSLFRATDQELFDYCSRHKMINILCEPKA